MTNKIFTFKKIENNWIALYNGSFLGIIGKRKPKVKGWGDFYILGNKNYDNHFLTRDDAAWWLFNKTASN